MATGSIILTPGAAVLPDGSSSNVAPAIQIVKSSASNPPPYLLQLVFDAGTEEWATWQLRWPADYASAPVAKVQYKMASATSGSVVWDVRLAAVTPGDSTDVDAKGFAAANTTTSAVAGTAGHLVEASVTLTNADSVTAGDLVVVRVARAAASGSDDATGDAELVAVTIEYTA